MAIKKIEYQLGLDASGVSKTTKGVETEVKAMGKAFEQLSKIKAFAKAGDDLKALETKLSAAKVKAAELGVAAESGGKKQQAAYQAAVKDVNKLTTSISTQTNTLAQQSTALKASGVNTKKLTAEQLRAERAYKATASQVKATAKLQSAYVDLGIKSSKQYRAEIALQEAARKRIAASGKASSADLARADAAAVTTIKRLKAEMAGVPSTASAAAGGINKMAVALVGIAAVKLGFDKIKAEFKEVLAYASEQEKQEVKLEAVIKATAGAVGFSASELKKYAGDLQNVTTFGDETTISALAVLATFKEIKGQSFKGAIVAAQDMSVVMESDLKGAIVQVGKALNDPITGMSALSKVGVSFTAQQKDLIKTLQESGDIMGAQEVILAELRGEFGGTAKAMRDTYGGSVIAVSNAYGDLKEEIGFFITKNEAAKSALKATEAGIVSIIGTVGKYREPLSGVVTDTVQFVGQNKYLIAGLGLSAGAYATVTGGVLLYNSALAASMAATIAGAAATAATVIPFVALAAAGATTVSTYLQMEEAQLQATQSTARADAGLIKNRLTLAKISRESGIVVTSYGEMRKAFDEGKISYDAATKTYLAGSSKQVAATKSVTAAATNSYQVIEAASGEALAKMQTEWQVYADKVVAINDSIINRQTSLVDKLRAMGRTTMDAGAAWKDLRKEADGYLASAAAAKDAGNLEQTIKEADKAAQLYERLNGEVKDGDKVLVSQAKALKTSMTGVEAAANLSIAALEGQKKAAEESADALNKQAGFALGDNYTEAGKAAKLLNEQAKEYNELLAQSSIAWGKVWTNMASSAKKPIAETNASIDNMARDRYLTLHITEIKGQQHGGLVGVAAMAMAMANGGRVHQPMDARHGMHFSGYGGGDRWKNHIIAEDGEYMIPKEPVRKGGLALARAYKQQDWQGMAKQLRPMLQVPPSLSQIRRVAPAHVASAPGQNFGQNLGRVIIEDRNIGVTYSQYMTAADYALLQRSQRSQAEIKARIDK